MTKEDLAKKERYANVRATRAATSEKRKLQDCVVYKIKVDESSLSKVQAECLKMIFVEAKWIYNDILNFSKENKISSYDTKAKEVITFNKDKELKTRTLKFIGSSMKQAVYQQAVDSIKSLAAKKKKSFKVGRLKFKSDFNSVNLKQYGTTHKILSSKRIRIQNVPDTIKVSGLKQFYEAFKSGEIEIANAKLLNTPLGYYIAITTFKNKSKETPIYLNKEIGIDMGIKDHIALSNGEKINSTIGETERLKRLQRKLARSQKGSNNRCKLIKQIRREYQKITNRKNDAANKIVAYLLSYEKVYMQDEQIANWKKFRFGRQIQHSILGRVKAKLINHPRVIVLDKFAPTTKFCPSCFKKKEDLTLADRIYKCECGYQEDRDIHAAKNMIFMSKIIEAAEEIKKTVPMGRGEFKLVEIQELSSKIADSCLIEARRSQPLGCD
jgi:putative transposase